MQGELLAHGPHLLGAPLPGPGATAAHITLQTLEGEQIPSPRDSALALFCFLNGPVCCYRRTPTSAQEAQAKRAAGHAWKAHLTQP